MDDLQSLLCSEDRRHLYTAVAYSAAPMNFDAILNILPKYFKAGDFLITAIVPRITHSSVIFKFSIMYFRGNTLLIMEMDKNDDDDVPPSPVPIRNNNEDSLITVRLPKRCYDLNESSLYHVSQSTYPSTLLLTHARFISDAITTDISCR